MTTRAGLWMTHKTAPAPYIHGQPLLQTSHPSSSPASPTMGHVQVRTLGGPPRISWRKEPIRGLRWLRIVPGTIKLPQPFHPSSLSADLTTGHVQVRIWGRTSRVSWRKESIRGLRWLKIVPGTIKSSSGHTDLRLMVHSRSRALWQMTRMNRFQTTFRSLPILPSACT